MPLFSEESLHFYLSPLETKEIVSKSQTEMEFILTSVVHGPE